MEHYDVVVVGGGAAGLFCAITSANRGRRVIVLEGSNKVGKKILMSGGGRCNFTNLHTSPDHFLSANPHFPKSALSRYTQWDFVALVERHGIAYHEKTLGQLFCDNSSKDIVAMLLRECETACVTVVTHCEDLAINGNFEVVCSRGEYSCDALVIATGGLSIPKMGASDFGYRIARQFGHSVVTTRAGLVPFTFTGEQQAMFERLSGVSCEAAITAGGKTFTESILFTHRGLSGPTTLQASSYWQPGEEIHIDLLPDRNATNTLIASKATHAKQHLRSILDSWLPRSLVNELQSTYWVDDTARPIGELTDNTLARIGAQLSAWSVKPAATEGYRTAEVTLGGVNVDELSSQTMESRRIPGLYFIGEVVDVTGHLGGFNFQWAWSSAWAAGQVA